MPSNFFRGVAAFLKSEDGATTIQYAVMVALIIVALISFIRNVGNSTNNALNNDANQLVQPSGS